MPFGFAPQTARRFGVGYLDARQDPHSLPSGQSLAFTLEDTAGRGYLTMYSEAPKALANS